METLTSPIRWAKYHLDGRNVTNYLTYAKLSFIIKLWKQKR